MRELRDLPEAEHEELAQIYVSRGVALETARQVATQLMAKDALAAHARDELGLSDLTGARPVQAALSSAASFAAGAVVPLVVAVAALAWRSDRERDNRLAMRSCAARLCRRPSGRRAGLARRRAGDAVGRGGHGDHGGCRIFRGCRRLICGQAFVSRF
ncbi:VIT1/CCC1 transporter family protein [Caulobacter segnis]